MIPMGIDQSIGPLGIVDTYRVIEEFVTGDGILEMALRAVLIYFFALLLVRVGKSRMLSDATVFDVILAFVLGSMLSRAINGGNTPLIPSLFTAALLVGLHAGISRISFHSDALGKVVKGRSDVIVRDGKMEEDAMHEHHLTERDLVEAMHAEGIREVDQIERAYFERDGHITFIKKARVLEVEVKDGVQKIRIET
jgi:uncharacterized membrane protein YcaP (DUF421 family)